MATIAGSEQPLTCPVCNENFDDDHSLASHRQSAHSHYYCGFCEHSLITREGYDRHMKLMHPAVQKVKCISCQREFPRIAAYASHIEYGCKGKEISLTKEELETRRTEKEVWHRLASQKLEFSASPESSIEAANPAASGSQYPSVARYNIKNDVSPSSVAKKGPNLALEAYKILGAKIPGLITGGSDDATSVGNFTWKDKSQMTSRVLFSQDANKPLIGHLAVTRLSDSNAKVQAQAEEDESDEWLAKVDPSHPNFVVKRTRNQFTGQYICPYKSCLKSFKHAQLIINHLNGPQHKDVTKAKCPTCLKQFLTPNAMLQHVESQGSKCKIAQTAKYRQVIDLETGGFVDVQGKHGDGTSRFVATDVTSIRRSDEQQTEFWEENQEERLALLKQQEESTGKSQPKKTKVTDPNDISW